VHQVLNVSGVVCLFYRALHQQQKESDRNNAKAPNGTGATVSTSPCGKKPFRHIGTILYAASHEWGSIPQSRESEV